MSVRLGSVCCGLLLCVSSNWLSAEVIRIGEQAPEFNRQQLPPHGMSMSQVSSRYGEPEQKLEPVGTPPISQWVYQNYTVYFEYSHVIHAVVRATPAPTVQDAPEVPAGNQATPVQSLP